MKVFNIEWDGIDTRDYPDFCDAYISYAEHADGTPLTQDELGNIDSSDMYDRLMEDMPWL